MRRSSPPQKTLSKHSSIHLLDKNREKRKYFLLPLDLQQTNVSGGIDDKENEEERCFVESETEDESWEDERSCDFEWKMFLFPEEDVKKETAWWSLWRLCCRKDCFTASFSFWVVLTVSSSFPWSLCRSCTYRLPAKAVTWKNMANTSV